MYDHFTIAYTDSTVSILYSINCELYQTWIYEIVGLKRTGKSCRLRWLNYLRPDVRRGNITLEEQLTILELHSRWGNRYVSIYISRYLSFHIRFLTYILPLSKFRFSPWVFI